MKYLSVYDYPSSVPQMDDVYSNAEVLVRILLPTGKLLYYDFKNSFVITNLVPLHEQDSKVVEK